MTLSSFIIIYSPSHPPANFYASPPPSLMHAYPPNFVRPMEDEIKINFLFVIVKLYIYVYIYGEYIITSFNAVKCNKIKSKFIR